MKYYLEYHSPYTQRLITQSFDKRNDAERVAKFIRSCGTRASVRTGSLGTK